MMRPTRPYLTLVVDGIPQMGEIGPYGLYGPNASAARRAGI